MARGGTARGLQRVHRKVPFFRYATIRPFKEGDMSSCYLCGLQFSKGAGVRRQVYTGSSVAGFNLSSIIALNWFMNSLLRKRPASIRAYYSMRTIFPLCR
jgi:hypothetical protein